MNRKEKDVTKIVSEFVRKRLHSNSNTIVVRNVCRLSDCSVHDGDDNWSEIDRPVSENQHRDIRTPV